MSVTMKMLSLKDIKVRMGVSESTINRMLKRKEAPFDQVVRAGRRVLLSENAYETWALGKKAIIGGDIATSSIN